MATEQSIPAAVNLTRKPKVLRIAELTGRSRHEVAGLLMDLWGLAKEQHPDGKMFGFSPYSLAYVIGADEAFWQAVGKVGWLTFTNDGLEIPRAWFLKKPEVQKELTGKTPGWETAAAYSILRGWVTGEFLQAWGEWIKHRKEIRHPLTERSARLQLESFQEWTPERAIAALRHSVTMGYRGIFEPKGSAPTELKLFNGLKDFLE